MKRLLMIAFHFPPLAGSSGIQRTLCFARHLPRFGWEPLILTAHPRAYERLSNDQLMDVPSDAIVERAREHYQSLLPATGSLALNKEAA